MDTRQIDTREMDAVELSAPRHLLCAGAHCKVTIRKAWAARPGVGRVEVDVDHQGRAGHLRPGRHRPRCPAGDAGRPRLPQHLRAVTMSIFDPRAPRRGPDPQTTDGR